MPLQVLSVFCVFEGIFSQDAESCKLIVAITILAGVWLIQVLSKQSLLDARLRKSS